MPHKKGVIIMNKKLNTVLFIVGATVINIVVTVALFIGLLLFFTAVLAPALGLSEALLAGGFAVIFFLSIVLSFIIYRFLLNIITKNVEMDKYFDPLFGRKHKSRPHN
jgi:hypothetical protein